MEEKDLSSPKYLGDSKVVSRLLRGYAQTVISFSGNVTEFKEFADKESRKLANVFLGKNPKFPGPAWFSPGQIDVEVGRIEGIDSNDPEERVAGALLNLSTDLLKICNKKWDKDEAWQKEVDVILKRYTYLFMGLPLSML